MLLAELTRLLHDKCEIPSPTGAGEFEGKDTGGVEIFVDVRLEAGRWSQGGQHRRCGG